MRSTSCKKKPCGLWAFAWWHSDRTQTPTRMQSATAASSDDWVPVRRRTKWRNAPPGTPLWERLPRDLQEHIARFLVQKMLWQLIALRAPSARGPSAEDHVAQIENLMEVTPMFGHALYTVYLLSVTPIRGHQDHAFGNGLVRFVWEVRDHRLAAVQGTSHVSVPWERRNELLAVDMRDLEDLLFKRLRQIARRAYEMSGSHYLPEHYLVAICDAIDKGVHSGTLRWINGQVCRRCTDFLSGVVNAPWHGRTRKQEIWVRVRIKEAMHRSLTSAPQA